MAGTEQKSETRAQTQTPQNIPLPDAPGINIELGLKRLSGNRELYRSLLKKFYDGYPQIAREIGEALAAGDRELAQRLAHSVKAVAGNIGIEELQRRAGELELAIKDGLVEAIKEILDIFDQVIQRAISGLEPYFAARPEPETEDPAVESLDTERLAVLLKELEPLVRKGNLKGSKALFDELSRIECPEPAAERIRSLGQAIGKYKFKEAALIIENLLPALEQEAREG